MSCTKVTLHRIALQCSPKRFGRSVATNSLADLLHTRFEEQGRISDLDEALALYREALELCLEGHRDRALFMDNIANCLHARAAQFGTLSDLDEALTLYRDTLKLLPQGHPDRALSLAGVGSCLYTRFVRLGTLSDLDEAISLHRDALQLRPEGHPDRVLSLGNIAICLHVRFSHRGALSDLDEALTLGREVLQFRPKGHPDRVHSLCDIAEYLHARFTQLGAISDLDEAIALERDMLELRPKGHPDRAISLSNIASSLHTRFVQFGARSDLDEAVALEREALELHPQDHPQRIFFLDNLTSYLSARFAHLGTLSDLDEALALQCSALELRPQGHPYRAVSLCNVADCLHTRFKYLGVLSELDKALALYREALELFPKGHPRHHLSMLDVARCLHTRSIQLGTLSDLDEAAALARNALQLYPQSHPNRASALGILAQCFHARSKLLSVHGKNDLEETFAVYSQLSDASQAVSLADLQCAKQWIEAAEECGHNTTVLAYKTFMRFSTQQLVSLLSLPRGLALLKRLTASTAVDAFSACVRHGNVINAVELLEQGRGVFWSQFFRLNPLLDEVVASGDAGSELADRFTRLSSLLRVVLDSAPNAEPRYDLACELNLQLQEVVADIHKLPGLSRFLQPPLFSDLRIAAAEGPVIIANASQYGCDGLIVLSDRDPVHVALPITKSRVSELSSELQSMISGAKFGNVTTDILVLLRELWDVVVFPIVRVFEEFCTPGSRIWWCPTAEFSLLPLHAAGSYTEGQPILSDLYIPSYTHSLIALVRARKEKPSVPSSERQGFLLVGHAQAQAPGQKESILVNSELSTIAQHIGSVAAFTCVQGKDATVAKVAQELDKNTFVHFACNGITDQNHPFKSGFALGDGRLEVEDIMRRDVQKVQFAYLSACRTTVGVGESTDEVIPLTAAMQIAGFHSVIGTMWAVDDVHSGEIALRVYENMVDQSGRLDHTRAALALYETMRSIRLSIPFDQWISYVHIGA